MNSCLRAICMNMRWIANLIMQLMNVIFASLIRTIKKNGLKAFISQPSFGKVSDQSHHTDFIIYNFITVCDCMVCDVWHLMLYIRSESRL